MNNSSGKSHKRLYNFFASKDLTIGLLAVLSLFLAVTTAPKGNTEVIWYLIRGLLILIVVNLLFCTLHRLKTLSRPVLIIHIGVILTFIGGGISSYGYVATVNIYEGDSAGQVFRWDTKKNVSLGVDIVVNKLNEEYYPVPVKVGVMKGPEKYKLYTLKTGESFDLDNYSVRVDALERYRENLKLSVFNDGHLIGSADTSGVSDLPADFPFEFKLVAYVDPVLKKTWVDLTLVKGDEIIKKGRMEINNPLNWEGLNFYHTATNTDDNGRPFIGIQITNDPGLYYVYTGFSIFSLGGVLYLLRRVRGLR